MSKFKYLNNKDPEKVIVTSKRATYEVGSSEYRAFEDGLVLGHEYAQAGRGRTLRVVLFLLGVEVVGLLLLLPWMLS